MKLDLTKPFEFYQEVLKTFANQRPEELMVPGFIGYMAAYREKDETINIHILSSDTGQFPQGTQSSARDPYSINIDSTNFDFEVLRVLSDEFHALATDPDLEPTNDQSSSLTNFDVGLAARGEHLAGYGTFGWGFELDGDLFALSNWHVFCGQFNHTPLGSHVYIDRQHAADLYQFEPVPNNGAV